LLIKALLFLVLVPSKMVHFKGFLSLTAICALGMAHASSLAPRATSLPSVPGADIVQLPVADTGTTLVHYLSSNVSSTVATHAVVVVHGVGRDAWQAFADLQAGVAAAVAAGVVEEEEVIIAAPEFFNGNDKGLFPWDGQSTSNQLVWKGALHSLAFHTRFTKLLLRERLGIWR
jgi:hypothetical protein